MKINSKYFATVRQTLLRHQTSFKFSTVENKTTPYVTKLQLALHQKHNLHVDVNTVTFSEKRHVDRVDQIYGN